MSKLIAVTGASRGIGRAIAQKFASAGFDIVACARKMHDLEALKSDLEKEFSVSVHIHSADLSDKTQAQEFARFALSFQRPIDVLVNNAGLFVPGDLSTEPDGNLETMIGANLYSAYHVTRGIVDTMKHRRSGHIFNMCSIASFTAYPNGGSYAISKFALLGFSRCLREELKPFGIKVTSVMPGATWTDSWMGSGHPEDRFIPARDVAEAVFTAHNLSPSTVVEDLVIRPQLGDLRD
ncbi:MAG: SDR family oxidoreductase [Bacteroidota bacterium]|jgi:short-subunit dehydrogenase|nr:MAG: short-chain dehydrogenase [Bacteroidota bacterium]